METLKKYRLWIALAVLVLPIVLRGLWYYRGFVLRPEVQTPDFAGNAIPQPPAPSTVVDEITRHEGRIIVIDYIHSNMYDPSELETFIQVLTERGARVEFDTGTPTLLTRLKYADAYIIFSPSAAFTPEEGAAIQEFVERGGRLAVFTDPTRGTVTYDWWTGMPINQPDTNIVNVLLQPGGISIANDYLYNLVRNEGNFRNVLFEEFSEDALTSGLEQIAFYGTHTVHVDGGTALIVGDANTLSSATDAGAGLAAAALSADGNILAVGDFSFLMPPYNNVADNPRLMGRVADFLLSGQRVHGIADFPHIFDGNVYVIATEDVQMGVELLGPLGTLQSALEATDTTLVFDSDPPLEADRIVIGLLTASEAGQPYLDYLQVELLEDGTVFLPGFGLVSPTGAGFLFYRPGDRRNTLVALANSPDELPALIQLLAGGDLSTCAISDKTAVCILGSGGGVEASEPEETTEGVEETATP